MVPEDPIDPSRIAYVYVQMADDLTARIASGEIPVGARLSGERALAEEYGVALGTVRRVIQELRDRQLVTTLPAKGTFVIAQHPS